jgi:FAD/FMN-containing dehydrogenase
VGLSLARLDEQLVRGVITADDERYDEARSVWNGMIDRHPVGVALCSDADEVGACVRFGVANDLPIAVRGGAHSVAGYGTVDDGLVIDLSGIAEVQADLSRRRVSAGGGCTWGMVDAETQVAGMAVPGGVFSRTGIAGLTLSGGYGWIRNRYGLSCASLRAADVLTADGALHHADADNDADLIWALRGGGGNMGVVTRFEYDLHPVGPDVYFLFVAHDGRGGRTAAGLRQFRDFCAEAPDTVSMLAFVGVVPETEEGFVEGSAGVPFVGFAGMFLGDPEEGERLLAPLRASGDSVMDASAVMAYAQAQKIFDDEYPDGDRYYWKSVTVPVLTDAAIDAIAEAGAHPASELSTVDVWHLAGAATRPFDGALIPTRASFLVNPEANWSASADDAANISWVRELVARLAPESDGSRYLNFAGFHEESGSSVRTVFAENYERLARLKSQYDPQNVFRLNPNVPPGD